MIERESTRGTLEEVEAAMRDVVAAYLPGRAGEMVAEQLGSGGKRLRARIALLGAEALRVPRGAAVSWAAAVEILHNATLVHDDIQDGDRYRRGKPTLWSRHGAAQAINAGDAMLMLPLLATSGIERGRAALSAALATHAVEAVRGQIAEMELLPHERLDWPSYVDAALGKTGALFALPLVGIALLAGLDEAQARSFGEPLRHLGVAFQIQDDVMDLYGDKGRDAAGSDLREGKVSALVVAHLERRPADRGWLLDVLRAARDATPDAAIPQAAKAFRESGALASAVERAADLRSAALGADAWSAHPGLSFALRALFESLSPTAQATKESGERAREAAPRDERPRLESSVPSLVAVGKDAS